MAPAQEILKGKGSGRSVCMVGSSQTMRPCRYSPARVARKFMSTRKCWVKPSLVIAAALAQEGWYTPSSYANHYAEFPKTAGVYLFLRVGLGLSDNFGDYRVLYVGKSLNLRRRQCGHEILKQIHQDSSPGDYVQRWFRPLEADAISPEEVRLIKRFNPPYNIIHRVRGA